MEYQQGGVESLPYRDLTQWTKGKCKADMPTKPAGKKKFYCDMHGRNKTHDTNDCFELKLHAKHTKQGKACTEADKVTYKDLD
eukprot:6809197-Ditylum_brightwellii.AAC.1